ncbi:MAG: NAD-dependent epimerase/dehydratase family protein [Propionibacteriales bacterium]|nr:NAD-dependent epimerase/dehydratase family protein [Propionibacteriales bacterium]
MRVVVVGASGNVGTALLEALEADPTVVEVVAAARRRPYPNDDGYTKVSWQATDIGRDDLDPLVRGADAVVHLGWLFQPTHGPEVTWANNVVGTSRVLEAVERCAVKTFVYSSSVGAYSPRTNPSPVDETWPTHGASSAAYAREKAYVERLVDVFEARTDACRVVRLRPAFVFHRRAAVQQRRLFGGPLMPGRLVQPELLPVLPLPSGLLLQTVHADDVAQAFRAALVTTSAGAFNVCADEVLHPADLAGLFDARLIPVPARLARGALAAAWRAHAVPAAPELLDAALAVPMLSNDKARTELGWTPQVSAIDALKEFFVGLKEGGGHPTPPLDPDSGPLRSGEFTSGVGNRP